MRKLIRLFLILIPLLCLCTLLAYNVPAVQERVDWRVAEWRGRIKYALNPPEQEVFVPQGTAVQPASQTSSQTSEVLKTSEVSTPSPPQTSEVFKTSEVSPTAEVSPTPAVSPTPTLTPTPPPTQARLNGVVHEYQMYNNCGPANLAMALSYWGWRGDQRETAAFLKPNGRDKNVMPYEMEAFVEQNTSFQAVVRVGGDLTTLKSFIAAGFPVIIEKGFEGVRFDGWMGHYEVVTAYDDGRQMLTVQDSYDGPNRPVPYANLTEQWRAFNFLYIVIYPLERQEEVLNILGPQAEESANYTYAANLALEETRTLKGRDLFFAWYNRGTNLMYLKDYQNAAVAYDAAFANYPSIPEKERPWRMLWYQTGPYFAYYYTGRYGDVVDLATQTLEAMSEPVLEESYYWRAQGRLALGDNEGAITDLRKSVEVHPGFEPGLTLLNTLGVEP